MIEVVRPRAPVDGDRARLPGMLGDGLGLARRHLEVADVEVVRVRVARAHPGLRPDTAALADGPRGPLDDPVLEDELLRHLVLDEDVGVVHPAGRGPDEGLQPGLGETEPVGEEALGPGG